MFEQLFNQIPKNAKKIAFYGAGTVAYKLKEELEKYNKDIKILYYIDKEKTKDEKGILYPIIKPYEIETIKDKIDLVLITIKSPVNIIGILELYDIPYITISVVLDNKIRYEKYEKDFPRALEVFKDEEDKELYKTLWHARMQSDFSCIEQYVKEKHGIIKRDMPANNMKHYLDYINREAIKTVIDCGFYNGANAFCFKKKLPNLEKINVIEPLYDLFKDECFDILLKKLNFVEIFPYAAWDKKETLEILVNEGSSTLLEKSYARKFRKRKIPTISIDELCEENNIKKVDFIKMDIEGAEMNALRGGGSIVKKHRPQLAISIYHQFDDFIYIPVYLAQTLENYFFKLDHYSLGGTETVLYAIPCELYQNS